MIQTSGLRLNTHRSLPGISPLLFSCIYIHRSFRERLIVSKCLKFSKYTYLKWTIYIPFFSYASLLHFDITLL